MLLCVKAKLKKLLRKEMQHVSIVLECNLELVGRSFCSEIPVKVLVNLHTVQNCRVAQGLHTIYYRLKYLGWNKLVNIHFGHMTYIQ